MKLKKCNICGCNKPIWKNYEGLKYCKTCWFNSPHIKRNKAPNNINKKSEKQIEMDKIYSKLRRIFLEAHPMCQAALPDCNERATDVHHKCQRGSNYLVVTTWMATCRNCHDWIHRNPRMAREIGLLE